MAPDPLMDQINRDITLTLDDGDIVNFAIAEKDAESVRYIADALSKFVKFRFSAKIIAVEVLKNSAKIDIVMELPDTSKRSIEVKLQQWARGSSHVPQMTQAIEDQAKRQFNAIKRTDICPTNDYFVIQIAEHKATGM